AFFEAGNFDLAAKNFRRAGCFIEAVDVVKKYKAKIQKGLADEIVGIARLEFLRKLQYERAAELFDNVEEQLDYMEDYGFDAARIHVLEHHKRYGDAAEVAFREHNILESIRLLSCSGDEDLLRQALSQAIRGLWMTMPYGSTGSQIDNPVVTSLLEQLSKLDLKALSEDEHRQLESFQAFHEKKSDRIIALAKANAALSRAAEALLCFAQCSRNLVALQNATVANFTSNSVLALSYYNGLAALIRNFKAIAVDSQRLLGFELAQSSTDTDAMEDESSLVSEFRLFSSSILFADAKTIIGNVEPTPFGLGLVAITVSESDITRLATAIISDKLKSEVQSMHFVANNVRYIQPCLDFAIFGNCKLSYCGRHEINTFKLPDDVRQLHFNERLRAHILQILIIHSYQAQAMSEYQTYKWTWTRKLYEALFPHFPPLGNVLCAEITRVRELDRGSGVIAELAYRVHHQSFASYGPRLHSMRLVSWHPDLVVHVPGSLGRDRSMIHHFIDFYLGRSDDALKRVIFAIHRVLFRPLMIEVNVLVYLLESIGRELIVQTRRWTCGISRVFDGLVLPQSWALDIVQHPPQAQQQGWSYEMFFETLYKTLEYLRTYEPGTDGKPSTSTSFLKGLIPISVVWVPWTTEPTVAWRTNFKDLSDTDSRWFKQIIYDAIKPDLQNMLSFASTPSHRQGVVLNPKAEPFIQGQAKGHASGSAVPNERDSALTQNDLADAPDDPSGQSAADIFEGLVPSQVNYLAAIPKPQAHRTLTAQELEAGKRILFYYRRYNFRQRVVAWFAVRTIWAYYSRYRLRNKVSHTATHDRIRKYHQEYKKDAEIIESPLLYVKAFRRHEQILLGPMPHVAVYLRGLERIIQKQKESNKKRLQKVQHEELEKVQQKMTVCSALSKASKKLIPRILPGQTEKSALHHIKSLLDKVQEVDALRTAIIESFGESAISSDLEEHYQLGVYIILTPSADPPKPPKPELNTSDLGDIL
ncbi:hypothetical protein FRC07_000653, partial [Ceratobasidium sp. 392]